MHSVTYSYINRFSSHSNIIVVFHKYLQNYTRERLVFFQIFSFYRNQFPHIIKSEMKCT